VTGQETRSLKVGDRVQWGTRTGIIELNLLDVLVVKWDGRGDAEAYTREAAEKQFIRDNPKEDN
jgi:hypothetical protein